jgi:hypothetical protein
MMLLRKCTLALALCFSLLTAQAADQSSLAGLVSEAGADWLFGTWQGTSDDGTALTHSFAWDLNKEIIIMRGEMGEMAYLGVTAIDPDAGEPKYTGYDSQGGVSTGAWGEESGDVALRLEINNPTEGKNKMAVVFAQKSGGLEMRIHGVNDWDSLQYPAWASILMKKKAGD